MKKEEKKPTKNRDKLRKRICNTGNRQGSSVQNISKYWQNSRRPLKKGGPCFVSSKGGHIEISHICPKRGCHPIQTSEANVQSPRPWLSVSVLFPAASGWDTLVWKDPSSSRGQWPGVSFGLLCGSVWREASRTLWRGLYSLPGALEGWENHCTHFFQSLRYTLLASVFVVKVPSSHHLSIMGCD